MCVSCAITAWLHEVVKPPRHRDGLKLSRATCPLCRTAYPRVSLHYRDHRLERCPACNPFLRNLQLDGTVSGILAELQDAIRRLRGMIPGDKEVERLMEQYGSDDGTETRELLVKRR